MAVERRSNRLSQMKIVPTALIDLRRTYTGRITCAVASNSRRGVGYQLAAVTANHRHNKAFISRELRLPDYTRHSRSNSWCVAATCRRSGSVIAAVVPLVHAQRSTPDHRDVACQVLLA